jgi:membrane protein
VAPPFQKATGWAAQRIRNCNEAVAVLNLLHTAWRLILHIAAEYLMFGVPRLAAALAYYAAVSMAPMVVVVIAIVGLALGSDQARQHLLWEAGATVGPEGVKVLDNMLSNIAAPHRGLVATLVGVVAILIGSTAFFSELRDSLNTILRVRPRPGGKLRDMLLPRMKAFAIVIGVGLCLTLSTLIGLAVSAAGEQLARWVSISAGVLKLADSLLALVLVTIVFALVFRFVPEKRLPWPTIAVGAIVTAVMFVAGKLGISYYVARAGVGSAYGAAGSLLVVLVWIYYCAQVFLIGALLTHTFAVTKRVGAAIDDLRAA